MGLYEDPGSPVDEALRRLCLKNKVALTASHTNPVGDSHGAHTERSNARQGAGAPTRAQQQGTNP